MSIYSVYRERGNKYMSLHHIVIGDGYPIVLLHGWTLDHQVMLHAMESLFEKRSGMKLSRKLL